MDQQPHDPIPPRPMPSVLNDLYTAMREWAGSHPCEPPEPPKPLILAAYWHSTDEEKGRRWREMIEWAKRNGCAQVLDMVSDAMADDAMIRKLERDWQQGLLTPPTIAEGTEHE